jgi:hypothetical protein
MAAVNCWRAQLAPPASALLLVEPDRACLARLEHGCLSAVHGARGNFADPAAWAGLLDRERHLGASAVVSTEVLLHGPLPVKPQAVQTGRWRFKSVAVPFVAGLAQRADPYLAMALSAL